MADVSVSREALSEYEKLRQANIERNEQFLKSLGVSHPVSDHTTHTTNTRHSHSHSHRHSHSQTRQTKSAAKKRKSDDKSFEEVPPVESRRRSRRIQQLSAEFEESKDEEGIYFIEEVPHRASTIPVQPLELTVDDAESGRVAVTAAQIQALIEKSDQNHDDLISNELIVHTAYRMSYMSNQALGTRLKSIAKAARASSYEKLLVFYYALVAANLPQLATSAREILEKIGVMTATER